MASSALLFRSLLRELGCGFQSNASRRMARGASMTIVDPIVSAFTGMGQHHLQSSISERLMGRVVSAADIGPTNLLPRLDTGSSTPFTMLEMVSDWETIHDLERVDSETGTMNCKATREQICDLIKLEFRDETVSPEELLDKTLTAIQEIQALRVLAECTTISTSNGVTVELSAAYDPTTELTDSYFYSYRLRVSYHGEADQVRLIGRHWIFENERGQVEHAVEKFTDGVVGVQPYLSKETEMGSLENFEYISGCEISTPTGAMHGAFQFQNEATNETFEVPVKRTRLLRSLNDL
eukprot:CAMPEP_0184532338 /NCGR_PEP_ID=MMETSP0198_2-20121128/14105_1 /TAXON_ID=1112570 /ORGANISM="Thraustochytrium sp., Strain LLF1b" /LENGTH=294 /DNA_ID=CAMNT_0026924911 /DNA_START=24 /DNA_END=908 /DNA_ORIENTATION=-